MTANTTGMAPDIAAHIIPTIIYGHSVKFSFNIRHIGGTLTGSASAASSPFSFKKYHLTR